MSQAITTTAVSKAATKLASMRRSLVAWVKFRAKNDAAGIRPADRHANEQRLASDLHTLLSELMPDAALPNANLSSNPSAAVQLAQIAISGSVPVMQANPSSMGAIALTWPILIVGGLLLAVVTAIKTAGDVAKDAEEKACIRAGACTDYGFWLKAGGVTMLAYVAWKNGLGDIVKRTLKKRGG